MNATMNIPMIISDKSVTVFLGGKPLTAHSSHPNFTTIKERLKTKVYEGLENLFNVAKAVTEFATGVEVKNGNVYYNGTVVNNVLTQKIVTMMQEGFDFSPMAKFLENLMKNPSEAARNQLYTFMENNNLPLTDDGCLLAYKKVQDDYTDYYTGKFNNKVGSSNSMPRSEVCDDPNNGCAPGFHAMSYAYASSFRAGQGHMMVAKVNPMDVVCIPKDCTFTKMRVESYQIVMEITESNITTPAKEGLGKAIVSVRRDKKGRFLKANAPRRDSKGRFVKNGK